MMRLQVVLVLKNQQIRLSLHDIALPWQGIIILITVVLLS